MKVLIKQARIISPSSPFNGQTKDILITDGIITRIGDGISEAPDQLIEQNGLCVSIGWMDIFADFADPGYEYRETLETGANAAAAGGFTDVLLIPNSKPVVDNKSQVEYIIQRSKAFVTTIHPMGSITKNAAGDDLSEMYDMRQAGAAAFSDGIHPVQSPGILLKALQYVMAFDGIIIQLPGDNTIGTHGLINEGIISTQLGLPGKPALAEELMIARDIDLVRYTGSKIHFTGVSTQKSIDLIKKAKATGLRVSCSVTPHHCFFCDEDLVTYDTNLKVDPPLRNRNDMLAVRDALREGVIDFIASHHAPQNWDNKTCEFEYAKNGMVGLETCFPAMNTLGLDVDAFVSMQTVAVRKALGLPVPEIREGVPATLSLFNPAAEYIFETAMIRSKSKNSPFIDKKFKGSVVGVINKNKIHLNN